jgi:hypothetical protein
MDSTLDIFAHICKSFLNKQNQKVNKHTQKLIAPPYISQRVIGIPLLILKKPRPAERATVSAVEGGASCEETYQATSRHRAFQSP